MHDPLPLLLSELSASQDAVNMELRHDVAVFGHRLVVLRGTVGLSPRLGRLQVAQELLAALALARGRRGRDEHGKAPTRRR